jgi:hypothetical protein
VAPGVMSAASGGVAPGAVAGAASAPWAGVAPGVMSAASGGVAPGAVAGAESASWDGVVSEAQPDAAPGAVSAVYPGGGLVAAAPQRSVWEGEFGAGPAAVAAPAVPALVAPGAQAQAWPSAPEGAPLGAASNPGGARPPLRRPAGARALPPVARLDPVAPAAASQAPVRVSAFGAAAPADEIQPVSLLDQPVIPGPSGAELAAGNPAGPSLGAAAYWMTPSSKAR